MRKFGLVWQIFLGLILGIAVGAIFYGNPKVAEILDPIGAIFIHLIKMIVVPIIISTLIVGVAGVGTGKNLSRLGGKTILYFEVITTIAIVIGLLVANIFQPGAGINMNNLAQSDISKYVNTTEETKSHGFAETLVNIVPTNIVDAMANGDNLAIIFFAVMFGLALAKLGERGKPVIHFFELIAETMFNLTNMVMKFAPFGVFALIGVTVSKFGVASLIPLGKLMIVVYLTMIFFMVVVLGAVSKWAGVNIFRLMAMLKEELLLAYSTASSEAVLPRIMEKLEKMGCPKGIVSFVIPTGYSFNLDGSTLYQALAGIFIAQMYGIDLSIGQQITFALVLMLTSKGIAGVPGLSFVVLLATLGSVGIPLEGLAFIAGIDRLLDMMRTVVNVVGNSVAAIVMSKWEGQFDKEEANTYLKNFGRAAENN
ncbi:MULTISPECIES: cation:dicarboxylate symporter family transporter [Aneurinibacillus]|jgi:proton glutamate symport protein|uniref:Proton glutamate symport protein n=1 Tax=Aneurinibacillus danicus TaxID=267746 RepID=A0A511VCU8_9BACL|nr:MULTISPECIES: cation:dicarboxylase symporter family transporter [Aneurinibacillus]GEN35768.1 proton glutamate symport protein [Aneurinibacillus danicus]